MKMKLFLPAGEILNPNPLPFVSHTSKRSDLVFNAFIDASVNLAIFTPEKTLNATQNPRVAVWVALYVKHDEMTSAGTARYKGFK
jgi:hypothetical protein